MNAFSFPGLCGDLYWTCSICTLVSQRRHAAENAHARADLLSKNRQRDKAMPRLSPCIVGVGLRGQDFDCFRPCLASHCCRILVPENIRSRRRRFHQRVNRVSPHELLTWAHQEKIANSTGGPKARCLTAVQAILRPCFWALITPVS